MRKKIFFCGIIIFFSIHALAQQSIRDARKKSWQCLVYQITADTAEKYISKYVVFPEHYLNEQPFAIWHADSLKYEELPAGNYLIFSTVENELVAEYYCQSNLLVFPLNNQHRVQLEVKDSEGNFPPDAKVWVNKHEVKYDAAIRGFQLKNKRPDEALIKITVPGDTLFMELSAKEDLNRNSWQQWWTNFSYTKAGRIITWPAKKIRMMVTSPASYWFRKRYRSYSSRNGYMIFNKPKYLPGDTVKFKAYILNKKGKQYKKGLEMFLEYSYAGSSVRKNMGMIKPVTPGAFVHEFVLGDSLESDRTYTVFFRDRKDHVLMRSNFKIEDYLLDEVAVYNLRSEKENYFRHDTLVFYANAKDANGLALMDGRVNFYLLTKDINSFYNEREFVPDTLWKGEKALAIEGDTKFEIPTRDFPNADLSLRAVAEFRNSNNEIQEKDVDIDFTADSRVIRVRQEGAYVVAEFMENGRPVSRDGLLSFDDEDKEIKIRFPYRQKLNPYVEEYSFWAEDDTGKIIASEDFETEKKYSLSFGRIQQKDTTGFSLYNPNRIPVHYTVFNGNKILAAGSDTTEWISWQTVLPKKRIYNVEWNYIWAGKEQKDRNTIALLDKILDTKISGAQTIYPGQTDTITVSIKDYKGNAAANVNLAAVSYNSQFKNDIRVNEPPYLQKFKTGRRILFDNYELDDAGFTQRLLLGKHQQWRNSFGLDTMKYYQLLFPKSDYAVSSSVINDFTPQLAVHIVEKGVPQEIYMLYINREFAWYNGVTDKSVYAFNVVPGYTQIEVRLRNKNIQIDSIYLQPFYKHDISFDLDHLPANAKVETRDEFYSPIERNQIERQIWQLQNDNRTNNGYIWQSNKLVYIKSNTPHLIGPFAPADSLQFFKPGDFDFKFPFESDYQYRLTPMMARLEREYIFPFREKIILPKVSKTIWLLGDTVVAPPVIRYYKKPLPVPFLKANDNSYSSKTGAGALKIILPKDSSFIYAILYSVSADTTITRIRSYQLGNFYSIPSGKYNLILITSSFHYLAAEDIDIKASGTVCMKFTKPVYTNSHFFVEQLRRQDEELSKKEMQKYFEEEKANWKTDFVVPGLPLPEGNGVITGSVTDKKGKSAIPGAVVNIKGYKTATVVKQDGSFVLKNIRPGNYVLVFSSVGYEYKEVRVHVTDDGAISINAQLAMSESHLDEVVVTGYGTSRRKDLTASISSVRGEELTSSLQGRVAGLAVNDNYRADSVVIRIRGNSSLKTDSKPLYVINGVPMDELPEGFEMDKGQIQILNDAAAVSLYGSRAANGVILITTPDFMPKTLREKFRDYAFWQPNLITDKNGEAKFAVTYPDNITGWQTFVIGMDKKHRLTKATAFTKSFKPLLAQLSTPQFLIEGDSSAFIGKVINYTTSGITLAADFRVNDKVSYMANKELNANGAVTDALNVVAGTGDTLTAQYTITASSGYSDGELRKIPVFKKGTEETIGNFWILDKDTSFSFVADKNAGDIVLHAQNNTLEVMLDEIKYLKEYPYYCMEQTASKLTGLLMEKKIREALKQPFTDETATQKLLSKLQKTQLFNGGWGWWEGGDANLAITNYVVQALLSLRSDALIESNIRNAVLYLQNRLPLLNKDELINTLFTLSETGHEMDYGQYLNKLIFDSLTVHQQWQVIKIKQQQKMNYEKELKTVMGKKTETMLGGLYWGNDSWYWESNSMATTALAFKVLEKEKDYQSLLKQMIQYFLERRQGGRWRNTVESANTLASILPFILKDNANFNSGTQLNIINGAENIRIDSFPFTRTIPNSNQPITVTKSGGGLVYFTAWQRIFNTHPEPVTDKFIISTWFERTGNATASLVAGEKVTMKIKINALKDAEYVQVEIPVPAGCTYAEKKQEGWKMHKEFLKNKMVLFIEKMDKGVYTYEIELEPRYSGNYQLNPARAELMYFPVFYGRNEMKKIVINK